MDGVEQPIIFISKSFTAEQRRWSTPEKEAYAIFYALRKLEYLLRDVFFVLETDHKNLIYLNEKDSSAKVKRWKLLIQEFNFHIKHIPGVKNIPADGFSRLCDGSPSTEYLNFLDESMRPAEILSRICRESMQPTSPDDLALIDEFEIKLNFLDEIHELWAIDAEPELTPELRAQMDSVHNAIVGHGGVKRTCTKLHAKGVKAKYLRQLVSRFISECPFCQKQNYRKNDTITKPFTVATTAAMQLLNIDTIGPLPADEDGFQYILVVIDCFSRWVMCYPTRSTEAEECAWILLQHFGIFGIPKELKSDKGSQFVNSVISDLTRVLKLPHQTTIAYSKEQNAIVERANKEVMRHLRALVFETDVGTNWKRYLPFAQRICNAEVIQSIGVSPAQIIFGNAIDLDREILKPNAEHDTHAHPIMSEYVKKLIEAQKATIAFAAETQNRLDENHVAKRQKGDATVFEKGDYVLLDYPDTGFHKGPPAKTMTELAGPFQVLSANGDDSYALLNPATGKVKPSVHAQRLRIFKYDKEHTDPSVVALKDQQLHLVERVLAHRGKASGRRKDLSFHIQWLGYGPEDNTWEPWANLRDNLVVHQYLRDHDMASLIPERYHK